MKKVGPMRFELMAFRLSVERSSQAELRALKICRALWKFKSAVASI